MTSRGKSGACAELFVDLSTRPLLFHKYGFRLARPGPSPVPRCRMKGFHVSEHLFCFQVTHRWADESDLERVAREPASVICRQVRALPGVRGAVGLSTCLRFELYVEASAPAARESVAAYFHGSKFADTVAGADLGPTSQLRTLDNLAALDHLFQVAAGLDSLLVGETEIHGQVRAALRQAEEASTSSPMLRTAFSRALETGRVLRSLDWFRPAAHFLGEAVADGVQSTVGEAASVVLVVGAGSAGKAAAQALLAAGRQVRLMNRDPQRGTEAARELGAETVAWDFAQFACVDAIVTAVRTTLHVPPGPGKLPPLFDLGQPANVPAPARNQFRRYYSLREILGRNDGQAADVLQRARDLAGERARDCWAVLSPGFPAAAQVLRAIQAGADAIVERELEKALQRLQHLPPKDKDVVRELARVLRARLLEPPSRTLSAAARDGRAELAAAAAEIFRTNCPGGS